MDMAVRLDIQSIASRKCLTCQHPSHAGRRRADSKRRCHVGVRGFVDSSRFWMFQLRLGGRRSSSPFSHGAVMPNGNCSGESQRRKAAPWDADGVCSACVAPSRHYVGDGKMEIDDGHLVALVACGSDDLDAVITTQTLKWETPWQDLPNCSFRSATEGDMTGGGRAGKLYLSEFRVRQESHLGDRGIPLTRARATSFIKIRGVSPLRLHLINLRQGRMRLEKASQDAPPV